MLRILALPLVVSFALACASSGYERASATADRTAAYRDNLVRLREQVALAVEALRALSENPGDSPRSNKETFETYTRELANLEAASKRSRQTYGRMDGHAESFFGGWSEDTARITNADLKHSAEERRAVLQANYERLAQGKLEADLALAGFVGELTDLSLYLEHDLTAAGIASARSTIEKAFANGATLQDQLGVQVRATDSARAALAPLKDLAPSTQVRGATSARVR
ncbi:MAG: DUF2959 family protein [Planctomycetes bacterium]|nr:DUF2959 family protein [Planctomycetota bacterium]